MKVLFVFGVLFALGCGRERAAPVPCNDGAATSSEEGAASARDGLSKASSSSESLEKSVPGSLTFSWGRETRSFPIDEFIKSGKSAEVVVDDPYYKKKKRYRALPLIPVLEKGFGKTLDELKRSRFTLEASDGFQTPIEGVRLLVPEVYLAFEDLDEGAWQPIGPRGANPGPLYVTWVGPGRSNTDLYPHPWALSRIAAAGAASSLSLALPPAGFGDDTKAKEGFSIFERRCLHCHSVNQEGGKLGPDLNVPRNVLTYRSESDVRAFIKNPESFRYSAMLPNPDLTEADLDGIVAYLRLMAKHQVLRESGKP
jgi:mono/diheme cytochrome c family protein